MVNVTKRLFKTLSGVFGAKEHDKEKWDIPIWDVHCHILPEVDDGAKNMQEALEMIRLEIKEGIHKIILTPHYVTGQTDPSCIKEQYEKLKKEVEKQNYPVELYIGNELFYSIDIVNELQKKRALTLGGSSYVLIEFETEVLYQKMKQSFNELLMAGYRPILAHMERFSCLRKREDRVNELIQQGVLMQVNANSFCKDSISKFLFYLAKQGSIHFIATDSHSPEWRSPQMKNTINKLRRKLEKEEMIEIFVNHPNKILKDEYI